METDAKPETNTAMCTYVVLLCLLYTDSAVNIEDIQTRVSSSVVHSSNSDSKMYQKNNTTGEQLV